MTVAVALPGTTDILNKLPLFDIAINWNLSGIAAFCFAVLSAMGLERALERQRRADAFFFVGIALVFAAGWLRLRGETPQLSAARPSVDAGALWLVAAPAVFAVLAWIFRRTPRFLGAAAIGLFLFTHLAEMPPLYPTLNRNLFYPQVPEFKKLPAGGEPYRVVGLGYGLIPNHATLYELEDARGYEGITNLNWWGTQPLWSTPVGAWFNRVDDPVKPFAELLNIRYAIGEPSDPVPAGMQEFIRGKNCAIFENPNALPRAFVPAIIRFAERKERVVDEMRSCADFSKIAWLDSDQPRKPVANGRTAVTTREEGPDLLLHVHAESPSWVVVSENAWKGWHAISGGQEFPLRIADHTLLAFAAPRGDHDVRLVYRPLGFTIGVGSFFATLAGLGVAAFVRRAIAA